MIKIVTDNKVYETNTLTELKNVVGEIFVPDQNSDVMLTYVVTTQPTSRRMAPEKV